MIAARERVLATGAAGFGALFAAMLDTAEASSCTAKVGVSSYSYPDCRVAIEENETLIEWPGAGGRIQRFRLLHDGYQDAHVFWNGLRAEGDADQELGAVTNNGRCWRGRSAEICFDRAYNEPDLPSMQDPPSPRLGSAVRTLSEWEANSRIDCAAMPNWNAQLSSDAIPTQTVDAMLDRYGFDRTQESARTLSMNIYSCQARTGFDLGGIQAAIGEYRFADTPRPTPQHIVDQWNEDYETMAAFIEDFSVDDPALPNALQAARTMLDIWSPVPVEAHLKASSGRLSTAVKKVRDKLASIELEKTQTQRREVLDSLRQSALAAHSADVAGMGFPEHILDSIIVLEGGGGERWISLREWVAALYLNGGYEIIERSQLDSVGAFGVVTKVPSRRPRGWYFTQAGTELFLTYVGEENRLHRIFDDEKLRYSLALQQMIQ